MPMKNVMLVMLLASEDATKARTLKLVIRTPYQLHHFCVKVIGDTRRC